MKTLRKWKPVPGYEGLYEVSNDGLVRSLDRMVNRNGHPMIVKGRMMRRTVRANGYENVTLCKDGTRAQLEVHRIVMLAFVGPKPKGLGTRHIDGNPLNNRVTNLAYGTQTENMQDAKRHGRTTNQNRGRTHCQRGHEFTPENTYIIPSNGKRQCRTCKGGKW